MASDKVSKTFDDVFLEELKAISKRRREANLDVEGDKTKVVKGVADSLVGLALSGGGVRSAAFNLGLLQSLHEDDLLRHIDYMSTVSGGGYVGASLSSLALHPQTDFGRKATSQESASGKGEADSVSGHAASSEAAAHANRYSLTPNSDGRQPPRVLELIHGGGYLRRPLIFLNRYLIGVILTNIVALSMVFALASLTAWIFRWLDYPMVMSWVQVLGFRGDAGRAFFPTVAFFTIWLTMWAVSYWRSGAQAEGRAARWFMALTIVSFFLALAALLGTGDIDFTYMRVYGLEVSEERKQLITGELKTILLIGLGLALLPYLRIRDLLRSGRQPRSAVEGWVFAIASRALLYGIPLVIFGWMARENISYYDQNRSYQVGNQSVDLQHNLTPTDFLDWRTTWQQIQMRFDKKTQSGKNQLQLLIGKERFVDLIAANLDPDLKMELPESLIYQYADSDAQEEKKGATVHDLVEESLDCEKDIAEFEKSTSFGRRWLLYLNYLLTPESMSQGKTAFEKQVELRRRFYGLRAALCEHINRLVLVDACLYKDFESPQAVSASAIQSSDPSQNEKPTDWEIEQHKLIAKAKVLEENIDAISVELRGAEADRAKADNAEAKKTEQEDGPASDLKIAETDFSPWSNRRYELLDKIRQSDESKGVINDQLESFEKFESNEAHKDFAMMESELKATNLKLLQLHGSDHLRPRGSVFSSVVWAADQRVRWSWFLWSFGVFLFSACFVNMNATSLHGFYRKMLSMMWITDVPGFGRRIPLARMETVLTGAPYHLISAAIRMIGRKDDSIRSQTDAFVFSQAFCGSNRTGYVPTELYMEGKLDLSNAIAISGAAVTPTQVQNPLLAALLMLSNSRLGQWLPNPSRVSVLPTKIERLLDHFPAAPLRLMFGALQRPDDRHYCFVSDGGHHENLGIELLLQRRCRLIIASDVTYDRTFMFTDFVQLIRRMKFEFGIQILGLEKGSPGVPLEHLMPKWILDRKAGDPDTVNVLSSDNLARQHYIIARILYPKAGFEGSPTEGRLIYIKPNFDGDEPVDLNRYQVEDPSFPHDHTSDQFYDPQKFESYRQLGYHIGRSTWEDLFEKQSMRDHHRDSLGKWAISDMNSEFFDHSHKATKP